MEIGPFSPGLLKTVGRGDNAEGVCFGMTDEDAGWGLEGLAGVSSAQVRPRHHVWNGEWR